MDYKEEYQKALERAKMILCNLPEGSSSARDIETIFPELKESKDEKIRKEIISCIKSHVLPGGLLIRKGEFYREDAISYLERQKDLEKILKPKFNRGDKITNGENIYTIWKIEHDCYVLDEDCCFFLPFACQEKWERVQEFKSTNWSEEDNKKIGRLRSIVNECAFRNDALDVNGDYCEGDYGELDTWLKSFADGFNLQPRQEDEPMEIKFAGKIYKVHGKKDMPGGAIGYIIEDEPGHYDCITNPDEVLGGGYGIKSNGSPFPTKEATFDSPHWKPSEEQIDALEWMLTTVSMKDGGRGVVLKNLIDDLKKLM